MRYSEKAGHAARSDICIRLVQKSCGPPTKLDIIEFARSQLDLEPDPVQTAMLRAAGSRVLLNCTRQWGKSLMAAVKAVHQAYTVPGSLVLVAGPGERQSGFIVEYVEGFLRRMGIDYKGDGKHRLSVKLPNGSRVVGIPGKPETTRGFSKISLMLIDEAALVPDDLYKTLRPMLAVSGGDLWLLSTPMGARGFFYDEWKSAAGDWQRISVKATECSRIPAKFLEEERKKLGDAWFAQEYLCEFVDTSVSVFSRALLEKAYRDDIKPLWRD